MGEIAQAEARQYSWDRSMDALFGQLYRKAFNARSQRLADLGPIRRRRRSAEYRLPSSRRSARESPSFTLGRGQ